MIFNFATASKIIFGTGTASQLPDLATSLGTTPCLVVGGNPKRSQWAIKALEKKGFSAHIISINNEPDTDMIARAATEVRQANCDVVIAIGGGSVLDSGKALAALITNKADIFDYLEVVGKGLPLTERPVPLITVPTTSGTGSEVTANAVLLSPAQGVKVSMRSTDMIPDIALVDPELMVSMPPAVTAATGMDALTQLIEAYVSNKANPMTDALCREGIMRAATSLHAAYADPDYLAAREDMALASLFSGIGLANAKLGAVHGFAAPIGGAFKAPHGEVCACLLPHVMKVNLRALQERTPESMTLFKFAEIAVILTGDVTATPEDAADWLAELCEEIAIPRLSDMGITEQDFDKLAKQAANASSMKGNPIELTHEELVEILNLAF